MIRKGMWRMLAVFLLVLIPARTVVLFLPEGETGSLWGAILPWCYLVGAVALFLSCRLDHRAVMRFRPRPCPAAGLASILSGVTVLVASLYALIRMVRKESDATAVSLAGDQPLLSSLCAVAGLLAAVVFLAWGVSLLRTGVLFREYPVVALMPPIWACLELTVLFITYTAQSEITKNFYSILPFALGLLFLFGQSSFFSDAGGGAARRKLYQYGAPFVLVGLGSSVPSLICLALGRESGSSLPAPMLIALLFLSLYAAAAMAALRRDTNLLLRSGRGTSPIRRTDPSLSVTLELDRVVADWKQMNHLESAGETGKQDPLSVSGDQGKDS